MVRRDRLIVVTALTAVIALSWAYLVAGASMGMSAFEMTRMSQLGMAGGTSEGGMACIGDDDARGLDARLCSSDVLHVVGHDGGDDAAQRGTDDPFIRDGQSQAARNRPSPCRDEHIRGRLSRRLGWLQPSRGDPAVGVADRHPFTDARRDQRDL